MLIKSTLPPGTSQYSTLLVLLGGTSRHLSCYILSDNLGIRSFQQTMIQVGIGGRSVTKWSNFTHLG